jgi:hypothetical protein
MTVWLMTILALAASVCVAVRRPFLLQRVLLINNRRLLRQRGACETVPPSRGRFRFSCGFRTDLSSCSGGV